MSHQTVLLVEDQNPYLYEYWLKALNGFEYVIVKRGDHAVQAFREHQPVLVLMDIRLPMMDGLAAIRQIRQLNLTTPIIVITAYDVKEIRTKAMAAGANRFFAKPTDYRLLYQEMVALVARRSDLDERGHKETLITNKMRRLMLLQEKKALMGISVPTEVELEIEDLQADIELLKSGG